MKNIECQERCAMKEYAMESKHFVECQERIYIVRQKVHFILRKKHMYL